MQEAQPPLQLCLLPWAHDQGCWPLLLLLAAMTETCWLEGSSACLKVRRPPMSLLPQPRQLPSPACWAVRWQAASQAHAPPSRPSRLKVQVQAAALGQEISEPALPQRHWQHQTCRHHLWLRCGAPARWQDHQHQRWALRGGGAQGAQPPAPVVGGDAPGRKCVLPSPGHSSTKA